MMLFVAFFVAASAQAFQFADSLFGLPSPPVDGNRMGSGFLDPGEGLCNGFAVGSQRTLIGVRFLWSCSSAACARQAPFDVEVWSFPNTFLSTGQMMLHSESYTLVPNAAQSTPGTFAWREYLFSSQYSIAPSDYTLAGDPASTVICVGISSTAAAGDNSGYQFLREAMVMRVVQSPNGNVSVPCQDADPSMFQTCNRRAADFDPAPGISPSYVTPTTADQGRLFYIEPLFEPLPSPEYSPPPFTCQGQPLIQLRHIAEQEAAACSAD